MFKLVLNFALAAIAYAAPIDYYCPAASIVNNTCTITDKRVLLPGDLVLTGAMSIVLNNSTFVCTTNPYCNVFIRLTGRNNSLVLMGNSTIVAKQIVLVVPTQIAILDTSSLSVSGRSNATFGTQQSGKGASMIGQGGSCLSASGLNYGIYNSIPTTIQTTGNQIGSMGKINDAQTLGGGRIAISCDSLNLTGSIKANAMPYINAGQQFALIGGSGGYIYLNTSNILANNTINTNASIQAIGGHGIFGGYGGAGGIIIFDSNFTLTNKQLDSVSAAGGGSALTAENVNGCGNGAAGSVYFTNSQKLLIDNNGIQTTAYTVIAAATPTIAQSFSVKGFALVKIVAGTSLSLSNLTTTTNSSIQVVSIQPLQLNFSSNISTLLDFSLTQNLTINVPTDSTFGPLTYNQTIQIYGGNVTLQGDIKQAAPSQTSKLLIDVNNLVMAANISAAYITISGRQSIVAHQGFNATSYLSKTCNVSPTASLFQCLPQSRLLTNYTFVQSYNSKFGSFFTSYSDVLKLIANNYTIYFVSFGSIQMKSSLVTAPRVGLCSLDVSLLSTTIDTSGLGCSSNEGLGKGNLTAGCSGSGASFTGKGGYGAPISDNYTVICQSAVPKTYYDSNEARYEGSGGASGNSSLRLGGSGGGIIWISANSSLNLTQSHLNANGSNGKQVENATFGSGGGSGGSIQLNTKDAYGNVVIDLSGGDGSAPGGGGGSGGQLITYLASNATSIEATINLDGGLGAYIALNTTNVTTNVTKLLRLASTGAGDGSKGVANAINCSAGYSGSFCSACQIGQYKSNYSSVPCQQCQNKPDNSVYTTIASTSDQCDYECTAGIESKSTNAQCLTAMAINIEIVGGWKGVWIIVGCLAFIILWIWVFIVLQAICQAATRQRQADNILPQLETPKTTNNQTKVDEAVNNITQRLSLRDHQIWGHEHRMYLIGDGSIAHPWRIPRDFPTHALHQVTLNRFLDFIKQHKVVGWSAGSKCCYGFMRLLFPYMADWQHRQLRKSHFDTLSKRLYDAFEVDFWIDSFIRTVRLTVDTTDTQLAYIDFIDQRRNSQKDYVAPKLPQVLLLAGNGTFSTPFRVDFQNDVLLKSLIFLNKNHLKKLLPLFFQQLNTLLEKVNFHKFHFQIKQDLLQIIELVEDCNLNVFNQIQTSAQFYLFESKTRTGEGGVVQQRNRNMPLDNKLIKDPVLFGQLVRFIQNKTYNRKSEIRFGLVIKSSVKSDEMSLSDRMQKGFQVLTRPNHEKDKDGVIAKMQQLDQSKLSLLQQVLLPESKQLDSEVCIYGQKSQTVRINDKSVRPFGLKEEQKHALILKLKKNQTNYGVSVKSFFYGIWIMLFKRQGRPSGSCSGPIWSFLFALFVAVDLLLATVFLCHIGFSHQNKLWLTYGIPFLAVNPGLVVIAPLWSILGCMFGSTRMLKTYSTMNLCMLLFNYPATLAIMIWKREQLFYEMLMVALIANKVVISVFNAKVRSYLLNPYYHHNKLSLTKEFEEFKKTMIDQFAKLSASQRQQKLIDQSINKKAEETFEFKVEHKYNPEPPQADLKLNSIAAQVIKPPVRTHTFAREESPAKTTVHTVQSHTVQSGYVSADQFSDNRHYPQVKYPAIAHESHSSLVTNEENITVQNSDSDDEVFGTIATSRLRPSSVPITESANKSAYEGYYY